MDNTFNTLEEIQAAFGTSLFGNDQITLRSEQRDAIDEPKPSSANAVAARLPAISDGTTKVFTVPMECQDAFW
jgi:hypothetical protein